MVDTFVVHLVFSLRNLKFILSGLQTRCQFLFHIFILA